MLNDILVIRMQISGEGVKCTALVYVLVRIISVSNGRNLIQISLYQKKKKAHWLGRIG